MRIENMTDKQTVIAFWLIIVLGIVIIATVIYQIKTAYKRSGEAKDVNTTMEIKTNVEMEMPVKK